MHDDDRNSANHAPHEIPTDSTPAIATSKSPRAARGCGRGFTYLRGNTWWIGFGVEGKRYSESSGSWDPEEAERLLAIRQAQIEAGTWRPGVDVDDDEEDDDDDDEGAEAETSVATKVEGALEHVVAVRGPRKLSPRRARLALEVARLVVTGSTMDEIAAQLGIGRGQVTNLRRHPDYLKAQERARASYKRESEEAALAGRAEALEAARAMLRRGREGDPKVRPADLMTAASMLEKAGASPAESHRKQARLDLLAALPAPLRRSVREALDGGASDYLAALTDDELERLDE